MGSLEIENNKREILRFLKKNVLATISTVNPQNLQPESALVAFCELENLEILMLTLRGSRKYVNVLQNNKVALVIGWELNPKFWATLQYEGRAIQVKDSEEDHYREIFLQKEGSPCTKDFFQYPEMKLFKITPTWIGYSRFPKTKKPRVIEVKF